MLRKILSYGLIAGLVVGISLLGLTLALNGHQPSRWGVVVGYLSMLIALSAVFVAIKRQRDVEQGGVIRFWPAFAMGVGISAIAGVCYVLTWEATLALTHMDFAGDYTKALIEQQRAKGLSGEALARFIADMDNFRTQYAKPLYRLSMTFSEIFPVGVLVSLVSAGLLRNSRFMPLRRGPA